ncbi:Uncharacterised protein [Dermacoccus nishinomiyaensis]|nr:Uncharacterised protein [Dermacoccus nishinomiyaensis]STD12578.1 Uncharacterised protein [Dermacoccus nishinomiyaensis]
MTLDVWLALASPFPIFGALAGLEALGDWWWRE